MAAQARFAPAPHRRALIGKIKVAVKELGYDDDTYRGALQLVTGQISAADCSEAELTAMVEHLRAHGFRPRPRAMTGKGPGARPAADHAAARKARALWISLYHLGVVENPKEKALEAFACRQLKVEAFQWADQSRCYKLIEALKAMAERAGWLQTGLAGIPASSRVRALKLRLCDAILDKLKSSGAAGAEWTLPHAAFALCGMDMREGGVHAATVEDLDICARALGNKLRGARP